MNQPLPGILDFTSTNILPKDGRVMYIYPFYSEDLAEKYFFHLLLTTDWQQDEMVLYSKKVLLPRLSYFYRKDETWPPLLMKMKNDIETRTGHAFNSVLLNLYRNEFDHVSWHSDRGAPEDKKVIASLSLGEERKFQLKHKTDKDLSVVSLELLSGTLLVMEDIQANWLHRIAKTKGPKGPRINLTFRQIISERPVVYNKKLLH